MPRPPVDPGFFDKVNYVIDAWSRPCDAPWYIYVETLWPAALKAFITLATFGWDDVARGYFRPRGLQGPRRSGKGRRRGRGLRGPPELGDALGRSLPGADEVKGEKWSNLSKTLWRIDSQVQLGLFAWLVADVTNDFAYNFTSVLYQTVWCQASTLGRFSVRSGDWRVTPGFSYWTAAFSDFDYQYPPPTWLQITGLSGPTGALVAVGLIVKQHLTFAKPTSIQIIIEPTAGGTAFVDTGPTAVPESGEIRMPLQGTVPPGVAFRVRVMHDAPWAQFGGGFITAMQNEDQ